MDINLLKIENAILFFIEKSEGCIARTKLMKLLWLSDRLHLNKYGRLILEDRYYALPFGLIPSKGLDISNEGIEDCIFVKGTNIESKKEYNEDFFFQNLI